MSSRPGFWRKCRLAFRCARYLLWAAVLLVLAAYGWFNLVGLPVFLKTRLVAALHERGVELEFSRMRLRFFHGVICDNVRVGPAQSADGPVLTVREVQLRLDYLALLHRRLQVDGLVLHEGNFTLPLSPTNSLAFTNLQTDLRFAADDTWTLDRLRADFRGVDVLLGGEIAHAPEFRNWKIFNGPQASDHGPVQASLKNFADTLDQIHLRGKSQLNARLGGDARDVHTLTLAVNARAPGVETPWFAAQDLEFTARLSAPATAPTNCDPAWSFWTNLQPFRLDWTARGKDLKSSKLNAEAAECDGRWNAPELTVTNFSLQLAGGKISAAAKLNVATRELNFTSDSSFDPGIIAALLPDAVREQLAQISWHQPPRLRADGSLVLPAWTNGVADWRAEIEPSVRLNGDVAVTNAQMANLPKLDSLQADFSYSNLVWRLPELELTQGKTVLELSGEENEATKDFHCLLGGKLDIESVRPFFTSTNAVRAFRLLFFRAPVALVLDVAGNRNDFSTLTATGRVAATDFAIRGQWLDRVTATFCYTNLTAEFFQPQLTRVGGEEHFAAEKVTLDLAGEKLFIHHGEGRVSPVAVGEAIGPKTAEAMAPYQFLSLPTARVDGCIPLKTDAEGELITDDADIQFDLVGTAPFRWRRFETPRITGSILWRSHYLILTNAVSECYGGESHGWGSFDVTTPGDGTDFTFFMEGTNVDFNAMGRALWSPTNQLRGALSGRVVVTHANSDDWRTWNGYGQLQLRNGLIWEAPIFGLMTPVLNAFTPGLDVGSSRATEGSGRFALTNGIIYTDSLELRSLTMRLDYVGTVDLEERVNARVKAQLLRNTPLVGSLFSTVLWPVSKVFECNVTGTLDQPKITPVYVPGILLVPLHPFRTMEKLFSPPATNNPPGKS